MASATDDPAWRPRCTPAQLRARADLYAAIRRFFAARDVLEVDTPLLGATAACDPALASLSTCYTGPGAPGGHRLYLQTSPEFAMKRLLAAGSGAIYQLGKAFRDGEYGRYHNPEFTLLEWYRPTYDHHRLMEEVGEFLQEVVGVYNLNSISYKQLFQHYLHLDAHRATHQELAAQARELGHPDLQLTRAGWLDFFMTHHIEPHLPPHTATFVYDYPREHAALACLNHEDPPCAERFEVYWGGVEIANGFHELTDADEQRQRFQQNNTERAALGLPTIALDEKLLAALAHGLPRCAGVALGVDRLLMVKTQATTLGDTLPFSLESL